MIRAFVRALCISALLNLVGCTVTLDWVQSFRAQRAMARHDYRSGFALLEDIIDRQPDGAHALAAARLGARVAHLEAKNYPLAIAFYRIVILRSPDSVERQKAQMQIAQIDFENLLDYDQAVQEYERLLHLNLAPEESFHLRLNLAKSQFQLNNLDQASNELDVLLSQKRSPDEAFEAKVLKANIMVAHHRQSEAASLWEEIIKDFPERSKKGNVALNLVVCYEELKEFGKAIEVLERMKSGYPNPEFLELRIERLRQRQFNQPGAQGLKR